MALDFVKMFFKNENGAANYQNFLTIRYHYQRHICSDFTTTIF